MSHPFLPFINRLKIVDKKGNVLPLTTPNLTPPQVAIIGECEDAVRARRPIRIITLKARQMGVSTIIEAIGFRMMFSLPNISGRVVSHDMDSNEHLLGMMRFYWTSWWANSLYTSTSQARERLAWKETNTDMTVQTAKSKTGSRSRTLQFIHCSEVGFWDEPEKMVGGMNQTMPAENPFTAMFLESTANGVGNYFHRVWEAAKTGDVEYKPMFFPWWKHPAYSAEFLPTGVEGVNSHVDQAKKLRLATPRTGGTLNDEEWMIAQYFHNVLHWDDMTIKLRLIWRRKYIATECLGDIDLFHQEYPFSDEEAFLSTGRNVFSLPHLRAATDLWLGDIGRLEYDPLAPNRVRFIDDPEGPLTVYRHPDLASMRQYTVGGDASKTLYGDYAVGQVLDAMTLEQVACWRQKIQPRQFAHQLILLGHYYNRAMLVPENNMSGGGVSMLIEDQYDNLYMHKKTQKIRGQEDHMVGWFTNNQTKHEAIQHLQSQIFMAYQGESTFVIHHQPTYLEMKNYIVGDDGNYTNNNNTKHDDTVMALAIAVAATIIEAPNRMNQALTDPAYQRTLREQAKMTGVAREIQAGIKQLAETMGEDVQMGGRVRTVERDGEEEMVMEQAAPLPEWAARDRDLYSDGERWEW